MEEKEFEFTVKLLKAKGKAFKGAVQNYQTPNGVIAVCFSTSTAYVFEDDQGCYTSDEMNNQMKDATGTNFPEMFEPYVEILDINSKDATSEAGTRLGLTAEQLEDVKSRLESLAHYSEEVEVKLGAK